MDSHQPGGISSNTRFVGCAGIAANLSLVCNAKLFVALCMVVLNHSHTDTRVSEEHSCSCLPHVLSASRLVRHHLPTIENPTGAELICGTRIHFWGVEKAFLCFLYLSHLIFPPASIATTTVRQYLKLLDWRIGKRPAQCHFTQNISICRNL